jgi:hypothetical protein
MAPKYQAVSLYLDATEAAKVRSVLALYALAIAQEFPISAKPLPVNGWPGKRQIWNILKLLFFNSL